MRKPACDHSEAELHAESNCSIVRCKRCKRVLEVLPLVREEIPNKRPKMLYISSCHCDLERQELDLFNELGIDVLSTGKFLDKRKPRFDSLAPPLDIDTNQKLAQRFGLLNPRQKIWQTPTLIKDFVDNFDIVYCATVGPNKNYLQQVWPHIKHKPVIYRTYGLQTPAEERFMRDCGHENKAFYTVRFSDKERHISGFSGADFTIYPYINEDEFSNYTGEKKQVFTAQNWYRSRYRFEPYNIYEDIVKSYNPILCGIDTPWGAVSRETQMELFRTSRVYFALGTKPSPITINLFQALMTGMPVVTWGYGFGSGVPKMYEIPEIIENYTSGLCSDDPREIKAFIKTCFNDLDYARKIGANGREVAIKTFGRKAIKIKWQEVFKTIGIKCID